MDHCSAMFFIFHLRKPHLLERAKAGQDGSTCSTGCALESARSRASNVKELAVLKDLPRFACLPAKPS